MCVIAMTWWCIHMSGVHSQRVISAYTSAWPSPETPGVTKKTQWPGVGRSWQLYMMTHPDVLIIASVNLSKVAVTSSS